MSITPIESLHAQIRALRPSLEDAALYASAEETLALSRRMDALLNRLMIADAPCSRPTLASDPYCAAPPALHACPRARKTAEK